MNDQLEIEKQTNASLIFLLKQDTNKWNQRKKSVKNIEIDKKIRLTLELCGRLFCYISPGGFFFKITLITNREQSQQLTLCSWIYT